MNEREMEKRLIRIESKIDKMDDAMKGNSYGNLGYSDRLDILEKFMKNTNKLIWMIIGASGLISATIGLIIKIA